MSEKMQKSRVPVFILVILLLFSLTAVMVCAGSGVAVSAAGGHGASTNFGSRNSMDYYENVESFEDIALILEQRFVSRLNGISYFLLATPISFGRTLFPNSIFVLPEAACLKFGLNIVTMFQHAEDGMK